MKTNNKKNDTLIEAPAPVSQARPLQQFPQVQGLVLTPQVFLSRDGESLIHRLPGNMRFEMHVNLYRKILGADFTPKERPVPSDPMPARPRIYGFIAQPELFLTRDGEYLVHRVLGVRIAKHVNFYKRILNIPFVPKSQREPVVLESPAL